MIKWDEVIQKPAYLEADETERARVKESYFNKVLIPEIQKNGDDPKVIKDKFYAHANKIEPITKANELKYQQKQSVKNPSWGAKRLSSDPSELAKLVDIEKINSDIETEYRNKTKLLRDKKLTGKATPADITEYERLAKERDLNRQGLQKSKDILQPKDEDVIGKDYKTGAMEETFTHPANVIGVTGIGGLATLATKGAVRGGAKLLAKEMIEDITWGGSALFKHAVTGVLNKTVKSRVLAKEALDEMVINNSTNKEAVKGLVQSFDEADMAYQKSLHKTWQDRKLKFSENWNSEIAGVRQELNTLSKKAQAKIKAGIVPTEELESAKYIKKQSESVLYHKVLSRGASHKVMNTMDALDKDIFNKLESSDVALLGRYREALRSYEIAGRETTTGGVIKIRGKKEDYADFIKSVESLPQAGMEPARHKLIMESAQKIDSVYANQAQRLKESGFFSDDNFKALMELGVHYNPRQVIEKLDPDISGKGIVSGLKRLEGSEKELLNDPRFLMDYYMKRTETMMYNNAAGKELYKLAQIPENGIVRIVEKGQTLKKGDGTISCFIDGEEKQMITSELFAKEWAGLDPALKQDVANFLGQVTGTKALKTMATGVNPAFAPRNLIRDFQYTMMSPEYGKFNHKGLHIEKAFSLPISVGQMARDYISVLPDVLKHKGLAKKYIDLGGGMGSEGVTRAGTYSQSLTDRALTLADKKAKQALDWGSKLGDLSESWTRTAHMKRALRNGKSEVEAAFTARDALDFADMGNKGRMVNAVVPYWNVGVRGTVGMAKFAKKDPALFALKVAQLGVTAGALYHYTVKYFKEDHDKLSPRDKAMNWNIPTPFKFKDERGEMQRYFYKIPKDHTQMAFTAIFENLTAWASGNPVDKEQIKMGAQAFTSMFPDIGGVPIVRASEGLFDNRDDFRNRSVWDEKRSKGPVNAGSEWDDRTPEIWKLFSKVNLSPERMKFATEQFTSSNNIFANAFGVGLELVLREQTPENRQLIQDKILNELSLGMFKRTFREEGAIRRAEEVIQEENTVRFEREREATKLLKQDKILEAIDLMPPMMKSRLGRNYGNMKKMDAVLKIIGPKYITLFWALGKAADPFDAAAAFHEEFKKKSAEEYNQYKTKAFILGSEMTWGQKFRKEFGAELAGLEAEYKKSKKSK